MSSSNKTLADALRILAQDIESADWVANAALQEAADRIDELSSEVEDLRNQNQEATDRIDELAAEVDDLRNQNHNNRVAAEARWNRLQLEAIRIKALEEAIDGAIGFLEMAGPVGATPDWAKLTATNLRNAKEAKP